MNIMNPQYKAEIQKYQKKDAKIAIYFWIGLMVLYAAGGIIARLTMSNIPMLVVTVVLVAVCIVIVLKNGEGLSSIGFRRKKMWPSLGIGLLCGIVPLIFNNGILPAAIYGWQPVPVGFLLYQFFYYLVAISLVEEMLFRGYIQTRLYGMFNSNVSAILIGALLFMLMHIPFQLAYKGIEIFGQLFLINLAFTFVMHIVFNLIYIKFNALYGSILFHTISNWSYDIFARDFTPVWSIYIFYSIVILVLAILGLRVLYLRNHSHQTENIKNKPTVPTYKKRL